MDAPLSLKIAFRFNYGCKHNMIVSLISIISIVGISLGVSLLIVCLSAMNGFNRELKNRILSIVPHGEIQFLDFTDIKWKKILKKIEHVPGVLAAAPYLSFTSLIEHYNKLHITQVKGIDPFLEKRLNSLSCYIQKKVWSNFSPGQKQIIIGKGLADILNIKLGDWLTMLIPNRNSKMHLLQPKRIFLQVKDILSLNSSIDRFLVIMPFMDAQKYLHISNGVVGVAIKVNNIFDANQITQKAGKAANINTKSISWISNYGYIYRDIQMIRTVMYLAMILVISVACFNIISMLTIAVKNKSTNIAILRILGSQDSLIYSIFIWYGFLTGLTGSFIGIIFGILLTFNIALIVKKIEIILGYQLISSDIYFINFLPTELHLVDVIGILVITLLLSLLATWYPARQAILITPIQGLNSKK